jgi:hypothetical protein
MTFEIEFTSANESTLTSLHGSMKKQHIYLSRFALLVHSLLRWCTVCSAGALFAPLVQRLLRWCIVCSAGAEIAPLVHCLLRWCRDCSAGAEIAPLVHSTKNVQNFSGHFWIQKIVSKAFFWRFYKGLT